MNLLGNYSNQGGVNEITKESVTSVIQEQQNLNNDNPSLKQFANGPNDKTTHCNQATQNVLKTVSSAINNRNIVEMGMANDMMGDKGFKDNHLFKPVDYKAAKENAQNGGLSIGGVSESPNGDVLIFLIGANIAKGEVANVGTLKYSGFTSLNGAINKDKPKLFFILQNQK